MGPKSDGLVPRLVGEQPELVVENRIVDLLTDDRRIEPGAQGAFGERQPLLPCLVLRCTDSAVAPPGTIEPPVWVPWRVVY